MEIAIQGDPKGSEQFLNSECGIQMSQATPTKFSMYPKVVEFLNEIIDYGSKCNRIQAKEGVFEYDRLTEIISFFSN